MELVELIRLLRRRLAFIILATALAGIGSYVLQRTQPPNYEATTTLLVGSYLYLPNPTSADIRTGIDLATIYAEMVSRPQILEAARQSLSLNRSVSQIRNNLTVKLVSNTSLLTIAVTDPNP
ncbi:MAG: hypothetical protein K8I30_05060, partial [Anaerolineae bacterium]|nr:hypothetical protein [Anaerolineae bacterium]